MKEALTIRVPMKILLVDDNKDNVELLRQILMDEYTLFFAYSGDECIAKAIAEQPELILLDVHMPKMDGYETMKKLQQDEVTCNIPVIFASAYYTDPVMIVRGLEQGAFDYLTKPIDESILLAKVRTIYKIKMADDKIRQQKDELQLVNDKLQSADKLKSIFLASMSHELRTPLNSIIGFTGLMLMEVAGTINEKQKEQLNRVKRNSQHLLELINDVLDISKIEADKVELSISAFDLIRLVNEIVQNIAPEIQAKGLSLKVNQPEKAITVENDPMRIRQILMNFMSNALKFTKQGSISVELGLNDDSTQAVITIKDTGIGIKAEHMRNLFEPFQQISGDFTNSYKGTGLGLYLCKKLSTLIQADIQVSSELDSGSQFTLILPKKINMGIIE